MAEHFTVYQFDPDEMPDALKRAIGLAMLSGSQNESVLCDAIGCLSDVRFDYGLSITIHMSVPQRLQAIRALARQRTSNEKQIAELDAIVANLDKANTIRNDLAHSCFCFDPAQPEILYRYSRKARKNLSLDLVKVEIAEIQADADFVKQAGLALQAFLGVNGLKTNFGQSRR